MISMWISFALFFLMYATKICNLWVVLTAWSVGLSIYLLIKNKLPSKNYIILSIILAVIVTVSYLGYSIKFFMQMPLNGITTLLANLAVFSVMEKYGDYELVKTEKKFSPLISVLLGLGVGFALGLINILLGKSSMKVDMGISISRIVVSFIPGISEEIANRAIFMAFFSYYFTVKNKVPSKFTKFTIMFMMTVPHCLAHGYGVVESLVLLVLFGIPFAILQKKRDLTSAMIAHTTVDLIRFVVFGLPV